MKVLVTGASGFLGGRVVERLLEHGHRVRAFVRRTSRTDHLERLGVEIVRGDLKDPASLAGAVAGVEVVVHAAATMSGTAEEHEAATVGGTRSLLDAAEAAGVRRFVHISSIVVAALREPTDGSPITEDAPYETDPRLLGTYTRAKLAAEKEVVDRWQRSTMAIIVIRPGLLYGPGGNLYLPRMGYPIGRNLYLLIGMGNTPLPVCYVDNCADAVVAAVERDDVTRGVFNVVDDEPITQIEYLREIQRSVRPSLRVLRLPYPVARAMSWISEAATRFTGVSMPFRASHVIACHRRVRYSNDRAKRILGWHPRFGLHDALDMTARHFAAREAISRRADIESLGRPLPGARPLRVCLVGCGAIARVHAKFVQRMPNARIVGLCDRDRTAASRLANETYVQRLFGDVEEMVRELEPDVVHVLTPPQQYLDIVRVVAERGCHILVEKPLGVNAAEARQMYDIAERNGVRLCVDHNHLYDRVMVRARRLLELGAVGDVLWVESYYGFDLGHNPGSRYMQPGGEKHWTFALPGGLFQNIAPHAIYPALEIIGEPREVRATARYGRVLPHADKDELHIFLDSEAAGAHVTVSLAASPRLQYLMVFGTGGVLKVDLLHKWLTLQRVIRGIPKPVGRAITNLREGLTSICGTLMGTAKVLAGRWTPYDGMEILIREFYRTLQRGEPPPVSMSEAIAVMEVMDEAWRQIGPLAEVAPSPKNGIRESNCSHMVAIGNTPQKSGDSSGRYVTEIRQSQERALLSDGRPSA